MSIRQLGHLAGSSAVSASLPGDPLRLTVPAWRTALYDELHARPFPMLEAPVRVSHLAVLPQETDGSEADKADAAQDFARQAAAHLAALCARFGLQAPAAGESCFYRDFGAFELRWERHTEFCTWTVLQKGTDAAPLVNTPLTVLPPDWLAALPGRIAVAVHLVVEPRRDPAPTRDELRVHFEGHRMIGCRVYDGRAEVWTAFRLHADGAGRFFVFHDDLNPCETGRLVQQLLEVETYRLMALVTLPLVRASQAELTAMDLDLATVVSRLHAGDGRGERALLDRLSGHAARLEQLRARLNYRLAATRAYYALVMTRLEQLRIVEIRGLQTLSYFLDRRLTPAVRTCEAAGTRLDDLSLRIDRAAELIRTRVELTIEEQNQALLTSMDRRSHLQLRLQQAVEGLSVVAISYYVVQLVHTVAAALPRFGIAVDADLAAAASVPLVVGAALGLLFWLRRRLPRE
ncbi:MAG: DUF3422 family protein [Pseudomonadota bacterium]